MELKNAEFALEMTQKYADNLKAILDNEYTTVADWEAEVKKLEEEIAAAKVKEQQYNIEKGKLEVANPKLISDLEATSNKLETAKNNRTYKTKHISRESIGRQIITLLG